MNAGDFIELSEAERTRFYRCSRCGEMVDKRQLDDVLFHEDHVQRPDIQYGGSLELKYERAAFPQMFPSQIKN
jgi:hypothetical protein